MFDNVTWVKPEMNFKQVISKYGYPFPSKEQAAFIDEYKRSKSEKLKSIRINGNRFNRGKISKKWLFRLLMLRLMLAINVVT